MIWIYVIIAIVLIFCLLIVVMRSRGADKQVDRIVEEVLTEELPELVKGKTGYADSEGIKIWYNRMNAENPNKGVIMLVMGHSTNIFGWPAHFYTSFLDAGYDVIRYDNRGVGMSDWMAGWTKRTAYNLEDMSKDALAILDEEEIDMVHVVGVSMGGMIAQRLAISHSDRLLSLTSIMSSGYFGDKALVEVPLKFKMALAANFTKYMVPPTRRGGIKFAMGLIKILRNNSSYEIDHKDIAQKVIYDLDRRKGINIHVAQQHTQAIKNSGSRYDELSKIDLPTLVIHGKNDPLIDVSHAYKYAPMIPNAKALYIEGLGHDLPIEDNDEMVNGILSLIQSVEA